MKIGIMGGTFNPIHTGHAILANYIVEHTDLDELWLMVSPQNPLKEDADQSLDFHRLTMAEMVSCRLEKVVTSSFEFELPRPSYTIDTLAALEEEFPDCEFSLIIGADNWVKFPQWKSHDEILSKYGIFVYPRRGFDVNIPEELQGKVKLLNAPIIEISSTMVREGIKEGKNMSFYVPDDVLNYINDYELYK